MVIHILIIYEHIDLKITKKEIFYSGGCQYEGRIYEPGVTFTPDARPCSVCICNRGDVTCRPRPCKDLGGCKSSMTLPGDCCPTCMDCGKYANASMWKQGPCQKCSCIVSVKSVAVM